MTDIVERLQAVDADDEIERLEDEIEEAADEIERLRAERDVFREALEEISKPVLGPSIEWTTEMEAEWAANKMRKYVRIARAALDEAGD